MADGARTSSVESASVGRGWIDWLLPSASDLIYIGILCALIFTPLAVKLLGDAGVGWHIRTGQLILADHAIPWTDSFSSTMGGKPWFAWEWLYDAGVGALANIAGLNAVTWFTAAVLAFVFAWMFRLLVRREMNFTYALLLVMFAMSASTIHFLARPHVVTWLLMLAFFWVLDSTERNYFKGVGRHRKLWALPLLMVVWVNVHGGFVLGFVLLAVFWFGAIWTWHRTQGAGINEVLRKIAAAKRIGDLTRVGLACVVASLVNPYGWKLHGHIYSYLTNRFLMDHVEEFQSPNFHGVAQKCFLILLVLSLGVLVTRGRKLRTSEGLLVLFVTYAGLYSSRNIPISSILLVMIVGPWLPSEGWIDRFSLRMSAVELNLRRHVWPVVVTAFSFAVALNGGRLGSSLLIDAHFDAKRMPVEAVDFLAQHDVKGPIFTPDYWGGYLIYRLYPGRKVVVDDRHDLYGAEFLKAYLGAVHGEQGWEEFLHQTDPGCVMMPRNGPLASILNQTSGWKVAYEDRTAIAFVRTQ